MIDLLTFADKITQSDPISKSQLKSPKTLNAAIPEPETLEPFEPDQRYTLTGDDVYCAEKLGDLWLLKDVNRTFLNRNAEVTQGFLLEAGTYYFFRMEYGRIWHKEIVYLSAAFRPCETVTETIDLSEEF